MRIPRWIHLAGVDGTTGNVTYSTAGTGDQALDIKDLLEVQWSCISTGDCGSGTWSVETAPDIVERVQELLGPNSFDHLAISVFQANKLAVYDFDFTILSQPGRELEGLIDFVTPYSFTGAWPTRFGQCGADGVSWYRRPDLNRHAIASIGF